jgi:hypothetical protein
MTPVRVDTVNHKVYFSHAVAALDHASYGTDFGKLNLTSCRAPAVGSSITPTASATATLLLLQYATYPQESGSHAHPHPSPYRSTPCTL